MELFNYWIYGVVAFSVLFALRAHPAEDPRFLFRAVLVWPFSIAVIAVVLLLDAVGWNMEATRTSKMFGFRKPTNKEVRGFAVTLFYAEIQMWKVRKA
jgi:hypothetical protein